MPRQTSLLSQAERRAFGAFLRRARGGRSKREVAVALAGENVDKADVNRRRITAYENGTVLPTVATTCRLAEIHGVATLSLLHKAGHVAELLRPIVTLLEVGKARGAPDHLGPAGALFALYAFPRRCDTPSLAGTIAEAELDQAFSVIARFKLPRGKLPHAMGLAKAALCDSGLPVDARRSIAAEYVHAYVRAMEPKLYATVSRRIYHQEKP